MSVLRPTDRFSVRVLSPPTASKEGRVALLRDGRDTGVELPGQVLEAALEAGPEWLLLVTHDVPYEEQLDILLMDADLRVLDRARARSPLSLPVGVVRPFGLTTRLEVQRL